MVIKLFADIFLVKNTLDMISKNVYKLEEFAQAIMIVKLILNIVEKLPNLGSFNIVNDKYNIYYKKIIFNIIISNIYKCI